jgi:hypothetical protein
MPKQAFSWAMVFLAGTGVKVEVYSWRKNEFVVCAIKGLGGALLPFSLTTKLCITGV